MNIIEFVMEYCGILSNEMIADIDRSNPRMWVIGYIKGAKRPQIIFVKSNSDNAKNEYELYANSVNEGTDGKYFWNIFQNLKNTKVEDIIKSKNFVVLCEASMRRWKSNKVVGEL